MEDKIIFLSDRKPTICQTFVSLEGEGEAIGELSLYVRLSQCNARCTFCDTKFSWDYDENKPAIDDHELHEEILIEARGKNINRVTVTGGEPLIFLKHFNDIFDSLNENIANGKLKHFGIESNGIIMSELDYAIELLRQFNNLGRRGIECTLTISPKIDYETSWRHVKTLNQDKLDKLYLKAMENVAILLSAHKINFKFIYDFTGKNINWEHTKSFIDYLKDELNVPLRNILLMPLTPDDPLGKDKQFWEESKRATAKKCIELGTRMSPRLHVDLGLD